jgi:hypothetical protein
MRIVPSVLASFAGLVLGAAPLHAQSVFRCTVDGRTVFSDRPCEAARPAPAGSAPAPVAQPPAPAAPAPGAPAAAATPAAWKEIVRREIMIGPASTGTEVTFECADRRRGRALAPTKPPIVWTLRDGGRHASLEAAAGAFCAPPDAAAKAAPATPDP